MQLVAMPGVQVIQELYSLWETKTERLQVQRRDIEAYGIITETTRKANPVEESYFGERIQFILTAITFQHAHW